MASVFGTFEFTAALAALLAQGEDGTGGGATDSEPGGLFDGFSFPLLMLLMFAILYFLWIRPEQKRQKERESKMGALKKGDTVVTTSGIIGKVFRVEDNEVVVHIDKDSKVKVRFLKSAIGDVLTGGKGGGAKEDGRGKGEGSEGDAKKPSGTAPDSSS